VRERKGGVRKRRKKSREACRQKKPWDSETRKRKDEKGTPLGKMTGEM